MRWRAAWTCVPILVTLAATLSAGPSPADAAPVRTVAPPAIDPGALGAAQALSGRPGPPDPTEPERLCAKPFLQGAVPRDPVVAQRALGLPAAWQFSRGAGVKVAVIDTGVTPHPRLPPVQAGGDYVQAGGDGLFDCDGHGTFVAGIIAARPSPDDAFAGVAPDADILSIRQSSTAFQAKNRGGNGQPGNVDDDGYGNVLTMAAAVVRAVDLGAKVINISQVACTPAGSDTADAALGAAVKYAYDSGAVVVAAAGNAGGEGRCKEQNAIGGWEGVTTVASPAWFSPYVLSVGSMAPDGSPSSFTLHGPWVSVAAVGEGVVSLDNQPGADGLVNALPDAENQPQLYAGTSFAAPYVSGLAALIRARFPDLSAQQVMDRITRTAHAPGPGRDDRVGAGLIDPLAALTAQLPDRPPSAGVDQAHAVAPPTQPAGPPALPRRVATIGTIACLAALGIGLLIAIPYRRKRSGDELPDFDS
ncbi:type VII secretion-associated serine protease mycosin [Nocardia aurantia]|uniref:Mycosin-3 n=1 Tax=Nocardia aurantia TaxID=2585199 RepID=A0A7K0DGT1_9NOCA|nr:type VII secretion-associated serine protease mycosin [Nocardia aurantia]MQY25020.1 Mycosin-3 [Nocardia aurantia]